MNSKARWVVAVCCCASCLGLFVGIADAQVINNPPTQPQFTPEQMQSIMMMRAMQGRGSRGVRTGVPQFIPLGGPAMMPDMNMFPADDQPTARRSSSQKRAEARQTREEQARAARDAKGKKAGGKDKADDPATARKAKAAEALAAKKAKAEEAAAKKAKSKPAAKKSDVADSGN